jgi:predicted transposase YbfD/YdcC
VLTASEVVAIDGKALRSRARQAIRASGIWFPPDRKRHYVTSLPSDAAQLNQLIRQHWGIKTNCTGVLNVAFGEDLSRKRASHTTQNFSLLNRIALNLLKQDKTCKPGILGKQLPAAWDRPYLLHLLAVPN